MSKYIDAEKLIKSVNNYLKGAKDAFNPTDGDADYYKGKIDACENIQELITSLQQEQPEVDIEKELIQWHKRHFKKTGTYEKHSGFYLENSSQLDLARHFYELGLNARKEE